MEKAIGVEDFAENAGVSMWSKVAIISNGVRRRSKILVADGMAFPSPRFLIVVRISRELPGDT